MKLKRIGIFSLIAVMLLGTLTGCNKGPTIINPNGEIESSEEDHAPIDKTQYMPVYDYKSLPLSNKLKNEELESYYMRQLSERAIICYDEIYNAAKKKKKEIVLSKSISPEALKQIMNTVTEIKCMR